MLKIKTKPITRSDWPRVYRKAFVCETLSMPEFQGTAALLRLDEVHAPLIVHSCGERVTLVDNGYYWIQLAPQDEHWWLTAMLDPNGSLYQYYFDITLENRIAGSLSEFDDLFLDVVALPDGRCELLDQNELDEAFASGLITQLQYDMAHSQADMLISALPRRMGDLHAFCMQLFKKLRLHMETIC